MAQASTEINILRDNFTKLSDDFTQLGFALQRYSDFGEDFYDAYLTDGEGNPTTDITAEEFHQAVQTLGALAASLNRDQRVAIAKMRR